MPDGLPSTAINTTQGTVVPPHAQTHETDGDDPVLGPLRLIGSQTISTAVSEAAGSVAVTGLDLTAFTRGGEIEVEVTGARSCISTNFQAGIELYLFIDGTEVDHYEEYVATGGAGTTMSFIFSSSLKWYTTISAGSHKFEIRFRFSAGAAGGASVAYANRPFTMKITERLPFRRA